MAGVNGVEIKVGQVWRCRDGVEREIDNVGKGAATTRHFAAGCIHNEMTDHGSLIELVKDENGFTIWRGGEQPEDTRGTLVVYRMQNGGKDSREADQLCWDIDRGNGYNIVAYKVVEQAEASDPAVKPISWPTTPQPADSAALAEETLLALGWTFDGQAWTEQPKAELPIGMVESPTSAPALLTAAAKHMTDRAATYDKPEGERSMAQTVAVFEAYHGIKLTEAQGWHFMQVLKDVRLFTRERYHADSAEDCIAYAALKAEARAYEGGV